MRRAVLCGCALALVAAAPAAAAPATVAGTDALVFAPANVAVKAGEAVTWTFDGTGQAHNVAANGAEPLADAGWSTFRTETKAAAPPATYVFTTDGLYRFICTVHPDTMTGTVTVGENAVPYGAPVPLSQQPLANDDTMPVVVEKVLEDKAKPKLSSVSARRSGRAVRVRFKVSEASTVQVRLKRGGQTIRTVSTEGTGSRSVLVKGGKAGRYRVEVRATDIAGNRSTLKRTSITIR